MKNKKLWIFLFLVAIFLLALFFLPVKEIFQGNILQFLQEKSKENFLFSALLYVVLCALAGAFLALPGITYALIAGTVFHAFWGTVLCALSASISAGISFLMGRYFLHDAIKPKLEKNPYIKKYFFSGEKRNLLFLLFLTRTIPVFPFNLQNYAYGITDIPFSLYFIASFLFMIPGTAMYTVAFAGFTEKKNPMLYFGISLGILALLLLASFLFKKKNAVEKDIVNDNGPNAGKAVSSNAGKAVSLNDRKEYGSN